MSETIANTDMARAWDGEEGDQWTQFADEFDYTHRSIWARFLETEPIGRADHVLDIGCGPGQTTRDAARLAAGRPPVDAGVAGHHEERVAHDRTRDPLGRPRPPDATSWAPCPMGLSDHCAR